MNFQIKFGTDGWRATPETGLNSENITICAQSFADYINSNYSGKKSIIIGYDTRVDSKKYAELSAKVIQSNGIESVLSETAIPTPIISHHIKNSNKIGGIIITASHNAKNWNGFKIRSENGMSFGNKEIIEVEKRVRYYEKNISDIKLDEKKNIKTENILNSYIEDLNKVVDLNLIKSSNIKISVDYMHGAVSGVLEKILSKDNIFLRSEFDPKFPGMVQPEPIGKNLKLLSQTINDNKCLLGIAFDGDGDRLGILDEEGNSQSASDVFALLSDYLLSKNTNNQSIGTTVTMSSVLEDICKNYDSKVIRTKVGFKYLAPLLENNEVFFAGEESGGYSLRGHLYDKDGILSSLLYLEYLITSKSTPKILLQTLYEKYKKRFFERLDIEFEQNKREEIKDNISLLEKYLPKYKEITKHIFTQKMHLITKGDSLYSISRLYNVSIKSLMKLNNLKSDLIIAGKKLKLPIDTTKPDVEYITVNSKKYFISNKSFTYKHTIKRYDNWYKIAKFYNVRLSKLLRWNNATKKTKLKVGQQIKIIMKTPILSPTKKIKLRYVVNSGDTAVMLSNGFGIEKKDLVKTNSLKNSRYLTAGKSLLIPIK